MMHCYVGFRDLTSDLSSEDLVEKFCSSLHCCRESEIGSLLKCHVTYQSHSNYYRINEHQYTCMVKVHCCVRESNCSGFLEYTDFQLCIKLHENGFVCNKSECNCNRSMV